MVTKIVGDIMKFTKMHGCGNDYIFVNCMKETSPHLEAMAKALSDRHFGIGSDGLILIGSSMVADYSMRMFNSDGSVGEMCGNAIRCLGKYVYEELYTCKTTITVETLAGIKTLFLTVRQNDVIDVMVDMGVPEFEASKIPVISETPQVISEPINIIDRDFIMTCVSMGNPHAVLIVDNVAKIDIGKYGMALEHNLRFPKRTNVEFVQVVDSNNIKLRVWERGAGETLACGTGACAATMACITNQLTDNTVFVKCLGGVLKVQYMPEKKLVFMSGNAVKVYDGEIDLKNS